MGKFTFGNIRTNAEDSAYYTLVEPNGLGRLVAELFGRLNQSYPGEFIKLKEYELQRYPSYNSYSNR